MDEVSEGSVKRERIQCLDGLRGLAILGVLLFHATLGHGSTTSAAIAFERLAGCGWAGVDLFFVLSGFLITGILLDTRNSPGYFRNFYARRTLRIFPLYYATLFAVFVVLPHLTSFDSPALQRLLQCQGWLWTYLTNIGFIAERRAFANADWLWLNHFWSLAIEEQFYVIWPFVIWKSSTRTIAKLCIVLIATALLLRCLLLNLGFPPGAIYFPTPCRIDGLASGGLLAVLIRSKSWRPVLVRYAPYVGGAAGLSLFVVFIVRSGLRFNDPICLTVGLTLLCVLATCTIVLATEAAPQSRIRSCLESRGLRFLGKYSYGIYVVHHLLIPLLSAWLPIPILVEKTHSQLAGVVAFFLLVAVVSVSCGVLSWHLFEKHFLKLKTYFEYAPGIGPSLSANRLARVWNWLCARRKPCIAVALLAVVFSGWFGYRGTSTIPVTPRLGSSKIAGTPDSPPEYRLTPVAQATFNEPVHLAVVPNQDCIWVVERRGRVLSWNAPFETQQPKVLGQFDGELASLAFHPRFTDNNRVFVTRVSGSPAIAAVLELTFDAALNCLNMSDARTIIDWPAGIHFGGALLFGTDGYLYISTGDGGDSTGDGKSYLTGQDLSDRMGSILRIDIDHAKSGQPYSIPPDNPFVGHATYCPEIWAYGLRNPWKMAVDPVSQRLWVSDVGEDLWESVYLVGPGDNCGWALDEGSHPFRSDGPRGPTPIIAPVIEHPHSEARAIVGGPWVVSCHFTELEGSYLYADHVTGIVFAARPDTEGKQITTRRLANSGLPITSLIVDRQGEILAASLDGTISRLTYAEVEQPNTTFPTRLSQTGLFKLVSNYELADDLVSYEVNSPLYSDGATKQRHIYVPPGSSLVFSEKQPWKFPDQTVFVKTFSLGGETDNPTSWRRVETRLLHRERGVWNGYSYRWNHEQTDAFLVEDAGETVTYDLQGSSAAAIRQQQWRFPSRNECLMCHTLGAHFVLGFNTRQLNRNVTWKGRQLNQLDLFESIGILESPLPRQSRALGLIRTAATHIFPRLADPMDSAESLNLRARSYLDANCGHCHTYLGGGNSPARMTFDVPAAEMHMLDERPLHGAWGTQHARIIAIGEPDRSVLLHRMNTLERERMPRVGSYVIDEQGVNLIREWISSLSSGTVARSTSPATD